MKVTGEMLDAFKTAWDVTPAGTQTGKRRQIALQAVLDLIERHGFIAEVKGDEVRVIAARTWHSPSLAYAMRNGVPSDFLAEVQWRAVPAERSAE